MKTNIIPKEMKETSEIINWNPEALFSYYLWSLSFLILLSLIIILYRVKLIFIIGLALNFFIINSFLYIYIKSFKIKPRKTI